MATTLVIQPVTRIEGHAKVTIQLNDAGNVDTARVNVIELRGFEKFCLGKPVEDLPRITPRICGVCPWSHHLASAKACDAVFGVEPPPAGKKLRELCNSIAYMEEHILHFYILAGPDFLLGPDADYSIRNVIGVLQAAPDIARKVVRVRHLCAKMLETLAGKSIHPQAAVPGGFSKPLTPADRDTLRKQAEDTLDLAKFSIAFAKENVFPKYLDVVKSLGVINTGFIGTVKENGALNLYDGKLRLMAPNGSYQDFPNDRYTEFIAEHIESWSYLKFPYAKQWGEGFSMDVENPKGIYRANTLARINVCDFIDTPLGAGRTRGVSREVRTARTTHAALSLGAADRTALQRRKYHPLARRSRHYQHGNPGEVYAAGGARRGCHGSAARYAHPRLHHRCRRPDHQRQPDCRHYAQQRSHQYVGHAGRQEFDP